MDADLYRASIDNALRVACASREGRFLLAHLTFGVCHLEAGNPHMEPAASQRFEGARDVGVHLRNELVRLDPELYRAVSESRFIASIDIPKAPKEKP